MNTATTNIGGAMRFPAPYERMISPILERLSRTELDPRHIEAWMRTGHGTLDGLSPAAFALEVRLAVACIDEAGQQESEALALSYGL